ncbi:hypothetical protein K501DRAFT_235056 [Backusella circina FSU 941]|nr:hypothetical protein K501DRAFT_235056 [Backusella circina FSU 941]
MEKTRGVGPHVTFFLCVLPSEVFYPSVEPAHIMILTFIDILLDFIAHMDTYKRIINTFDMLCLDFNDERHCFRRSTLEQ